MNSNLFNSYNFLKTNFEILSKLSNFFINFSWNLENLWSKFESYNRFFLLLLLLYLDTSDPFQNILIHMSGFRRRKNSNKFVYLLWERIILRGNQFVYYFHTQETIVPRCFLINVTTGHGQKTKKWKKAIPHTNSVAGAKRSAWATV